MTTTKARLFIAERVHQPRIAFADRLEAGRLLASVLVHEPDPDAVVFALPRGGVPVAAPVADALRCDLRPAFARKLPLPAAPEMGFGAVALDGTVMLNRIIMGLFGITDGDAEEVISDVRREVVRRAREYPGGSELPELSGRRVLLIDDGIATGYSTIAAARMLRAREPASLAVAAPVGSERGIRTVADHCDELYCLIEQDAPPFAVASFYRRFPDLSDDDVRSILAPRVVR